MFPRQKRVVLVRQRPAIGDALLLGPLVRKITETHPQNKLTVITDFSYMSGGLASIFRGIPGVDKVENISPMEWTTESNHRVYPIYPNYTDAPETVKKALKVYDANGQFIEYEREHHGNPPMGIAEFWLNHHGFTDYQKPADLLPHFNIPSAAKHDVDIWLNNQLNNKPKKPLVGVVLRAGDKVRDWNFGNIITDLGDYLWSAGYQPIGIDTTQQLQSYNAISCYGKDINFVAGLMERCDLVVTPDTGLLHLAQAVGTKTVGIWGIMRPELRTEGYSCSIAPEQSLGFCRDEEELENCKCSWKFQQWSCLRRLKLGHIISAIDKAMH